MTCDAIKETPELKANCLEILSLPARNMQWDRNGTDWPTEFPLIDVGPEVSADLHSYPCCSSTEAYLRKSYQSDPFSYGLFMGFLCCLWWPCLEALARSPINCSLKCPGALKNHLCMLCMYICTHVYCIVYTLLIHYSPCSYCFSLNRGKIEWVGCISLCININIIHPASLLHFANGPGIGPIPIPPIPTQHKIATGTSFSQERKT